MKEATPKTSSTPPRDGSYFGAYLGGISSYLPTKIQKQLSDWSGQGQSTEIKEKINWTSFDELEFSPSVRRRCLFLMYSTGFHIWDVENLDEARELASRRDGSIKCMKSITASLLWDLKDHKFTGKLPIVAVSASEDNPNFPNTVVKLYSLKLQDYVYSVRFPSEVYSIQCNSRLLVVCFKDQIYGLDLRTLEKVLQLPCYPNLNPQMGVVALGPRWIAIPGDKPVLSTSPASNNSNIVEVAKDVAKDLASGLYYLGDIGSKTVYNYLKNEPVASPLPEQGPNESAGTVVVYDFIAKKLVSNFRAHTQPLSIISFDRGGILVATSSIDGHNFHIFKITPSNNFLASHVHLYKLVRGMTHATITDITFNYDSRWVAVSSTRGTTHIFAINPEGGNVSASTHLSPVANSLVDHLPSYLYSNSNDYSSGKLMTMSVVSRIKQTPFFPKEVENTSKVPPVICQYIGFPPSAEEICVLNQFGVLRRYSLNTFALPSPEMESGLGGSNLSSSTGILQQEPKLTSELNFCRGVLWPDSRPDSSDLSIPPSDNNLSWVSYVEISTYNAQFRPLWIGPQFTFKTFQRNVSPSSSTINGKPSNQTQNNGNHNLEQNNQDENFNPAAESLILLDEKTPAKKLNLRMTTLLPNPEIRTAVAITDTNPEPQNNGYTYNYISNTATQVPLSSSPPGHQSDAIRENIALAMATPIGVPINNILAGGGKPSKPSSLSHLIFNNYEKTEEGGNGPSDLTSDEPHNVSHTPSGPVPPNATSAHSYPDPPFINSPQVVTPTIELQSPPSLVLPVSSPSPSIIPGPSSPPLSVPDNLHPETNNPSKKKSKNKNKKGKGRARETDAENHEEKDPLQSPLSSSPSPPFFSPVPSPSPPLHSLSKQQNQVDADELSDLHDILPVT